MYRKKEHDGTDYLHNTFEQFLSPLAAMIDLFQSLTSSVLVPRGRRRVVAAADHAAGLPLVGVLAGAVAVARASIEKSEIRQNLFSLNWQSRATLEKLFSKFRLVRIA